MSDNKKVMLIVNPVSGKKKLKNKMDDVVREFADHGYDAAVYNTSGYGDAERFARTMSDGFDIVVCCGGDGTLNEVINGLMKAQKSIPVGYIPAGSTNDFATSMNIPLKYKDAISLIATGESHPHDIGRLNDMFFHYTASFGIFSKCSYATSQKLKNLLGHTAYVLQGALEAADIKVIPTKVICDGKDYSGEYIFGGITNSLCVGGVIKYKKDLPDFSDGLFEMLLVKKPSSLSELVQIFKCVQKSEFDEKYFTFAQGRDFYFEFKEDIPWTADGEYGGAHKINNIRCFPSGIKIYREK